MTTGIFLKRLISTFTFLTSLKKTCLFNIILYICLKLQSVGGFVLIKKLFIISLGVEPHLETM